MPEPPASRNGRPRNLLAAPGRAFATFLRIVEWLGNCLPHPVTLFALLALLVALVSGIAAWAGWEVVFQKPLPGGGFVEERYVAQSILSGDGFRWLVDNLVDNFAGFTPLGTVLVALLGVAVAERSGLLGAAVRFMILSAPPRLVTLVTVFAGVQSNIASEMGYVVLIPLAMGVFHALGRHPFAGLAAAFAGVSGGYSANLLLGTIDPLLAGITQETARIVAPGYEVHAAVNWYFMIVSVFMIVPIGWAVTTYIVEPRLGTYDPSNADETIEDDPKLEKISAHEKRGLKRAGIAALLCALAFAYVAGPMTTREASVPDAVTIEQYRAADAAQQEAWEAEALDLAKPTRLAVPTDSAFNGVVRRLPAYGVLRNPDTGGLLPSPFTGGVVAMIFVFFIIPGFVYGRAVGTMKNDRDIIDAMAHGMSTLGLYIVLVFFAAQFVAMFNYSGLGRMLAVVGADGIRALGIDSPIVFIPFILMCCFINLMLGSASAQWAATAPIFVPMLMGVGYSPEVIQAAYRIGDSTTNIITPMMSYFGLILAVAARYDKKLGIGTMIATMLPYSIAFLIGWMILFYVWVFGFGFPVGPGAPTHFTP
ncbi:MAG: AbgT family transporter [Phycisphaerales bacterium JB060]